MANIDEDKIPVGGKETPIPGRLHDVSEDNVVVGAVEVYDDDYRKRQSKINKEVQRELTLHDLRITNEGRVRETMDTQLNAEINAKQVEIGAIETELEPRLDSPKFLTSGTQAFHYGYYQNHPEWVRVIVDGANRVLWGIKADGSMYWSKGVPDVIKDFITKKLEENLLAIEFEENGDIAAYYGEEGNIEDVYMDSNGDLIIEQVINAD